jgi:hypothetical protein
MTSSLKESFMKRKKTPSWTFRYTVVTILTLLAFLLTHENREKRVIFGKSDMVEQIGSDPIQILDRTIRRIEKLESLTAKINLHAHIGSVALDGSGIYEELFLRPDAGEQRAHTLCYGGTSLFRLHLELARTNEPSTENQEENLLDIVCDKNTLWTYTQIEGEKKLTELKLGEMAAILIQACDNEDERKRLALNQMTFPIPLAGFPGLGGITGTLRSLKTWYEFGDEVVVVSMRGGGSSLSAWRITGRLKSEAYEKSVQTLLSKNAGARKKYMNQFPSLVEVYISREYEFPYRICYYSVPEPKSRKKEKLITLDLTDVYENHFSVTQESFFYSPGGLNSTDVTRSYIEKLIPGIEF